jgi:hypothetical protein
VTGNKDKLPKETIIIINFRATVPMCCVGMALLIPMVMVIGPLFKMGRRITPFLLP